MPSFAADATPWLQLATALATLVAAFVAAYQAFKTHKLVNSRMTKLLALTEKLAHAQGLKEGREEK